MKKIFASIIVMTVVMLGCKKEIIIADGEGLDGWTTDSHAASTPNYAEIFDDSKVHRIDLTIDKKWWKIMENHLSAYNSTGGGGGDFSDVTPVYVPCNLEYNGKNWYNVGVRYKGNSSLASAGDVGKLPFRLKLNEFANEYPEISNQNFYGFQELSLSSNFNDQSVMREKVASDLFRDFGVPCSRSVFCRVYVDYGDGPIYFGLYTMLEVVFDTAILNEFGTNTGNCYKPDGDAAQFSDGTFDTSELENKTGGSDFSDVQALYDVINASNRTSDPAAWRTSLEAVFDMEIYLKYMAANLTIQNWDTYGRMSHNYYMYNDPATSKLNWIPWDNNEAFDEGKQGGAISIDASDATTDWPLLSYIIADATYEAQYKVYLRDFIDNHFNSTQMSSVYNNYYSQIEQYVTGTDGEIDGYSYVNSSANFSNALNDLLSHVTERYNIVDSYAP